MHSSDSVSDLTLSLGEDGPPVVIETTRLGPVAEVLTRLDELRTARVNILVSPAIRENCVAVQILASLGVNAAIGLHSGPVDWDACTDLAYYAFYSRTRKAAIEPFTFMAKNYRRKCVDIGEPFLDSPRRYLHLSPEGKVALTPAHLSRGGFLSETVGSISESTPTGEDVGDASHSLAHLLEFDGCSVCQGWRLCGGRFAGERAGEGRCREFFTQILEAIEFCQGANEGL